MLDLDRRLGECPLHIGIRRLKCTMPIPVHVHVKIGDISKTSRTNIDVENATFTLQKGQGFNAETVRSIDTFLAERASGQVGEIARTHWSLSHARQPEGSELSVPDTASFAQAHHIDIMRVLEEIDEEPTYRTIAVHMSCSSELPKTANVVELRGALGLPNDNLLASGVFSSFIPPQEPDDDVSDADHAIQ
ncbi:hypothetical protein GQ600_25198 [Phytophthora cactorum]|nr:hypothetical protein GQ600_25198 [Phytophthora cactorum]